MSNKDDRMGEILRKIAEQQHNAPAPGPGVRVTVSLEPEAAAMLEALVTRMDTPRRIGERRAQIIEQGIRTIYRRTYQDIPPEDIPRFMERLRAAADEQARKNMQWTPTKRDNV